MRYVHVEAFCVWGINTQDSTHCLERFFELIYLHDGEGADAWAVRLWKVSRRDVSKASAQDLTKHSRQDLSKTFSISLQSLSRSL